MSDEQVRAVKALRDACELLMMLTAKFRENCVGIAEITGDYKSPYLATIDNAMQYSTEAIREVERWIV